MRWSLKSHCQRFLGNPFCWRSHQHIFLFITFFIIINSIWLRRTFLVLLHLLTIFILSFFIPSYVFQHKRFLPFRLLELLWPLPPTQDQTSIYMLHPSSVPDLPHNPRRQQLQVWHSKPHPNVEIQCRQDLHEKPKHARKEPWKHVMWYFIARQMRALANIICQNTPTKNNDTISYDTLLPDANAATSKHHLPKTLTKNNETMSYDIFLPNANAALANTTCRNTPDSKRHLPKYPNKKQWKHVMRYFLARHKCEHYRTSLAEKPWQTTTNICDSIFPCPASMQALAKTICQNPTKNKERMS